MTHDLECIVHPIARHIHKMCWGVRYGTIEDDRLLTGFEIVTHKEFDESEAELMASTSIMIHCENWEEC